MGRAGSTSDSSMWKNRLRGATRRLAGRGAPGDRRETGGRAINEFKGGPALQQDGVGPTREDHPRPRSGYSRMKFRRMADPAASDRSGKNTVPKTFPCQMTLEKSMP